LGAEVEKIPMGHTLSPRVWRLLAANDEYVDYFLVRDADARVSEREAAAVREWLSIAGRQQYAIHCIRDHPKHVDQAIVDGLWGGRPRLLKQLLKHDIARMIDRTISNVPSSANWLNAMTNFLNQVLWPLVKNTTLCHDSVSPCDRWTTSTFRRQFPSSREGEEYVGQKFDAYQKLLSTDSDQLNVDVVCT